MCREKKNSKNLNLNNRNRMRLNIRMIDLLCIKMHSISKYNEPESFISLNLRGDVNFFTFKIYKTVIYKNNSFQKYV